MLLWVLTGSHPVFIGHILKLGAGGPHKFAVRYDDHGLPGAFAVERVEQVAKPQPDIGYRLSAGRTPVKRIGFVNGSVARVSLENPRPRTRSYLAPVALAQPLVEPP